MEEEPFRREVFWKWPSHNWENYDWCRPRTWGSWMGVYMKRWQYWPPWTCSNTFKFTWMDACDGERASKLLILPLLGGFVWFFNRPCSHHEED